MIDPLEAVIQWLKTDLTIVGGRVANKHRFNVSDGWTIGQKCLSVHLDGAQPELYAQVQTLRLELHLYGAADSSGVADVMAISAALVALQRTKTRISVTTSQGIALVYYFQQASGLSIPFDEDLKIDMGVVFFDALVAETAVTG